jgi:hypothetical protein
VKKGPTFVKDQYCGDINDYRKYGIIRQLLEGSALSLGMCWMLTPSDGRTDGKHTSYLAQPKLWRRYDPVLFDFMHAVVHQKGRLVRHVEESSLFMGARFFSEAVPDDASRRREWFDRSRQIMTGVDLLFCDPDNGLEVSSVRFGRKGSSKYMYWAEVQAAWADGHSLLIYQHFPRRERVAFMSALVAEIRARTGAVTVVPFSTANVLFLLIIQNDHASALLSACARIARQWAGQVEVLGSMPPCESQVPSSL